jgi:hypothetical protein
MTRINPDEERRRLAEFYAGQIDGELEQIAGEAYELTDLAKEALKAELATRGLAQELVEQPPALPKKEPERSAGDPIPLDPLIDIESDGELEFRRMITIRQFRDLPEALLAKGSLDSAGIDSQLADDNIVRLDWFWSNLMGGVKLRVSPDDAAAADEILNQPIPEGFDALGTGNYEQPRCPKCQSLDVSFEELNKPVAYLTAYLGVPIPWRRRAWRCHSCQQAWEGDGTPAQDSSSS